MTRELVGHVAVDSGQVMVTDPCYLHDWQADEFVPDQVTFDAEKGRYVKKDGSEIEALQPYTYDGASKASLRGGGSLRFALGHAGAGVCVPSGYGDGLYPAYVERNHEGRVIRLTVEFDE